MFKGLARVLCLGGLLIATAGAGCSAREQTQDKGATLQQGLTVLERTPTSLSVAFREKNATIFMQAKRGRPTAERYQKDPKSPKYEVDARFMDANGFVFYIQQGGDDWLDPTWEEDLQRQIAPERPLVGSNEVLFRLATDASKTLRADLEGQVGTTAVAELAPVVDSIVASASVMHVQYREQFQIQEKARLAKGLPAMPHLEHAAEEITYGTSGPEDNAWSLQPAAQYSIALHSDDLGGLPGFAGGYHSSTARSAWNGGAIYWTHVTCNHGRCATEMPKRSESAPKAFAAGELYALHCSGEYKWDADGGNYGHNCHDDSRIQLHNFRYKSWMWGTTRWCDGGDRDHDISVNVFAVELDQGGYPEYSSNDNKGFGSSGCGYTLGCSANWMGANDGCDCQSDGTWCPDSDCGSKPATVAANPSATCDYKLGCSSSWMGAGDGCDCTADGVRCADSDCH